MADHPNKHIRAALRSATQQGWSVTHAGPRAHRWGTLGCAHHGRDGFRIRIMSTPRNPEQHARTIQQLVDQCPHADTDP